MNLVLTVKKVILKLPRPMQRWARQLNRLRLQLTSIHYYGKGRFCEVCNKPSRKFIRAGARPREDAKCPRCGALERHRLLCLFLLSKTNFSDSGHNSNRKMLHVAPELCLEAKFKKAYQGNYVSADKYNGAAMVQMDICEIPYADNSFDAIYCSHVLEHVLDDGKAMREFYRVLKSDGWAILLVPITAKETLEDPSVTSAAERFRLYGQPDHVRRYGPDYVDRLRAAGFVVESFSAHDLVDQARARELGLSHTRAKIFYCTK